MENLLATLFVLIGMSTYGQLQEVPNTNIQFAPQTIGLSTFGNSPEATACGPDTNGYTLAKATGLEALSINNATSASAMSQYFDAPQSLTISGVNFYAWKPDITAGSSMVVNVEIYAAAADSTPLGLPLASTTTVVDTTFGAGTLDILKKNATFTLPLTVTSAYLVVVSNPSATPLSMVFNSWNASDGAQEWLSSALIGTNWLRAYAVNIGGVPFDADCLFEPIVNYTLDADFTIDDPCFLNGTLLNFTNTSSPVLQNRMYNIAEFQAIPEFSFTWDYGDGSPLVNLIDGTNNYATAGAYSITLTDTLYGWTTNCAESKTLTTDEAPTAAWTSSTTVLTTTFTNISTPASVTTYLWDFGDGNTATSENPVHTYTSPGIYTVCLTVTNSCGSDSSCAVVNLICPLPTAGFSTSNSNLSATFVNSTSGGTGTTYLWDFGDGNTSTLMDPTHTYAANGMYIVCLTATDACGTDSTCTSINVVNCLTPTASFTSSGSGASYIFTNTSTTIGNVTYAWDFGDGNNSALMNPSHTYTTNGNFVVTLTITDSCGTNMSTENIISSGVSLMEIEKESLNLFPNPAQDVIQIESNSFIRSIELLNISGKKVYTAQPNELTHKIETKKIANGTYLLSIEFETGRIEKRRVEIIH